MVVCKFFQQGYCRFGQSCRFEHVYGSKYSYHATSPAPPAAQSVITDEQLISQVQTDVQSALKGGQWLLSCYAPFKEKPNFPGISDLSPEEARLFIYEAKANNSLDQAIAYFNNLAQEARTKHEKLLHATPNLVQVFRSLYLGETLPSPFSETQQSTAFSNTNSNAATSVFRSAMQSSSVFGQSNPNTPSVFGAPPASNNVFGSQNPDNTAAKSIFAQASQNVFGNNQQPPSNPKSIFANASQSFFGSSQAPNLQPDNSQSPGNVFQNQGNQNQNVFGQSNSVFNSPNGGNVFASSPGGVFGQRNPDSVFGQSQAPPTNVFASSTPSNVFAPSPSSVFGQAKGNVFEQVSSDDSGVYSRMEDVSSDEVDAFKCDDFKLGFIPEIPPPHSFCS